jgi:hypothetical protein
MSADDLHEETHSHECEDAGEAPGVSYRDDCFFKILTRNFKSFTTVEF